MPDREVIFDEFYYCDHNYKLKTKLTMVIQNNAPDNFCCDYPDLGLYAWGKTFEECRSDIIVDLHHCYQEYAFEDDSKLDKKAQELKVKLLALLDKHTDTKQPPGQTYEEYMKDYINSRIKGWG